MQQDTLLIITLFGSISLILIFFYVKLSLMLDHRHTATVMRKINKVQRSRYESGASEENRDSDSASDEEGEDSEGGVQGQGEDPTGESESGGEEEEEEENPRVHYPKQD